MGLISPDFREKLVIAVAAVYGCSYCSWLRTALVLSTEIDREEIIRLLSSSLGNYPEDEAIALIYAQHRADSNANPQSEPTQRLLETYGCEKAEAINLLLRMNRIGNLSGNGFDTLASYLPCFSINSLSFIHPRGLQPFQRFAISFKACVRVDLTTQGTK